MLSSTDPLGNATTYAYDSYGDLTNTVDPLGHSTTNYYDGNGNLVATSDALGDTTANIYSGDLLIASVDPIGTMTTNTYDQYENLIASATVGNGVLLSSNTYTYDANGNRLTSTVWRRVNGSWEGDTTTSFYDAMNRVIETINPDGGSNTTVYTATGQQAATIDANGNTTSYTYDDENRLIATTNADGTTTSSTYDSNGNRIASTDQEGRVTQYQYDALNRLTNTIYPDGAISATVYDALGRVAQTIDARGTITANVYDVAGRRIAVTNAVGTSVQAVSSNTYDQDGNQITATDADGHTTTNVYDALNRQVQVQYPNGTASETVYDRDSRSIAQTNQDGIATLFGYDGSGRLTSVTKAPGMSEQTLTQYQYDEAGNEIAQIDTLLRTNMYIYDGMGRKISHILPGLQQSEGWAYDFNGNQIAHTNLDGYVAYSLYDAMNRMTNRFSGWTSEYDDYSYTPTGQRSGMYSSKSGFTITEVYDSRDRLIQKGMSWGDGYPQLAESLTYAYDANGNVASIKSAYANGVNLVYAYDPLNRLTNVLAGGQTAAEYSYDLAGNLTSMHYGNGVTNQYQYDSLNRLTNLVWATQSSSLASFAYRLMGGGTRTNLVEGINNASPVTYEWSFDNLYRLTNENISASGNVAYAYDPVGNRTNQFSTISAVPSDSYTYDTNDEVLADSNGNYPYYDNDNELIGWGDYSWTTVYGIPYDYLGRLIYAANQWGDASSYWYDSEDNLIGRQVYGGDQMLEVVDDRNPTGYPQILEEISQGSGLTRVYNYGLGLVSQQQFNPNTLLPSVLSYYGYDGHGNVRFLMDTNGTITDTYTYDAFGNLISQWYGGSGPTPNDYLYCGLQYDLVSGLYNNRARRMFCPIGRFISMDTYEGNNEDPLSLHKYLYAADDPVDYDDPSGNESVVETLAAVGIGVSIGASALVTYNAAELLIGAHNYAAISAVGQRLKIPVMQSPPEDDNQYRYFVHGTSTGAWGNSTRIDTEEGFRKDFGRGFYTFPCNPLGLYWAADRTRGLPGVPFLLVERISNSDYGELTKLDFNDPRFRPAWGPFVNDCRNGKRQRANKDLVIGPVAMYDHASEQWVQSPYITIDQYKFEAGGAAKLQFFCILPVITQLEAGF